MISFSSFSFSMCMQLPLEWATFNGTQSTTVEVNLFILIRDTKNNCGKFLFPYIQVYIYIRYHMRF